MERWTDVAMFAHELGSALAPARNAVQLLRRSGAGAAEEPHLLEVAHRGLERAERLLQNLSSLALVQESEPSLEPTDLAALLRRAEEDYRDEAAARGIRLVLEPASELLPVPLERFALEQVLANLLSNALKFTPAGGAVTASAAPARGVILPGRLLLLAGSFGFQPAFVQLRIQDTGSGLSEETRRHLFQPFYRGPESAHLPGMGLGLAVSQRLVRRMRGDLRAEPVARGAALVVTLPADTRTRRLVERVDAVVQELEQCLQAAPRSVAVLRLADGPALDAAAVGAALGRRLGRAEGNLVVLSETTAVGWSSAAVREFMPALVGALAQACGSQARANLRLAVRRAPAGAAADPLLLQASVRCRWPLAALVRKLEVVHGQDPGRGR